MNEDVFPIEHGDVIPAVAMWSFTKEYPPGIFLDIPQPWGNGKELVRICFFPGRYMFFKIPSYVFLFFFLLNQSYVIVYQRVPKKNMFFATYPWLFSFKPCLHFTTFHFLLGFSSPARKTNKGVPSPWPIQPMLPTKRLDTQNGTPYLKPEIALW